MADLLPALLTTPWLPLVVFAFCLIDGFFPPIPSETVVIGALTLMLSAGTAAGGAPYAAAGVIAAAALGAAAGDSIAYYLGRRFGLARWAWLRRPRVQKALEWAGARVHARPAMLLLTGRYIPVGRVAVNMTAGATRLPYRRFLPLSLLAAVCWTAMSILLSVFAASWLGHSPVLAAVVGVVISVILGLAVDLVARLVRRILQRHDGAAEAADAAGTVSAGERRSELVG